METSHPYDTVVTGTRDPAIDVQAVQEAVDQGGRVLLEGIFDFGQSGTVFITNDVEIHGEKPGVTYQTKITGGYRAFTVGMEPREWTHDAGDDQGWFNPEPVAVLKPAHVTIKNIHFERPLACAIYLAATQGAVIAGNKFVDAIAQPWPEAWQSMPSARAIEAFTPDSMYVPGWFDADADGAAIYPRMVGTDPRTGTSIRGTIIIRDNDIDGKARPDPGGVSSLDYAGIDQTWQGLTHGLFVWYSDADLKISGNKIQNVLYAGIVVGGYFGKVTIRDNHVNTGRENFLGRGIWVVEDGYGRVMFGKGCSEGNREIARTQVTDNTVTVDGAPSGEGIAGWASKHAVIASNNIKTECEGKTGLELVYTDDSLISNNEISLNGGPGISIRAWDSEHESSRNVISKNRITGIADIGIRVGDFEERALCEQNSISENDLSRLELEPGDDRVAASAAFLPRSANNVFRGHREDIIIDLGIDNKVSVGKKASKTVHKEMLDAYAEAKDRQS